MGQTKSTMMSSLSGVEAKARADETAACAACDLSAIAGNDCLVDKLAGGPANLVDLWFSVV